jgi:hypothetical protein
MLRNAGRRSRVEGAQVAGLSRRLQVERGKCRDIARENVGTSRRGIKREGSVVKQRDRRVLVGTVGNAEGRLVDLRQRLPIVERGSRFRILSEIRSRHRFSRFIPFFCFLPLMCFISVVSCLPHTVQVLLHLV